MTTHAHQRVPLTRRQFSRSRSGEPRFKDVRQSEVEVVSAEEQVITDGDAMELYLAILGIVCACSVTYMHQRKVGGAPTNVADQNRQAGLDERLPIVFVCIYPGITRRLPLFYEHQVLQPGLM